MWLTDMLQEGHFSLSFEVFPPKNNTAFDKVSAAALAVAQLKPAFVSVTYGAGGGTSDYTVPLAREIRSQTGVETLAHLTCVSSTREMLLQQISRIRDAGIDNVMALRGDIPAGMEEAQRQADFPHAVDLIRELRRRLPGCCIGGACYPEIHPESPDQKTDIRHLKEKVEAGCSFLTTQMFFDNHLLFEFLYKIREAGITVPVFPGIMPITTARQVERARALSNASLPQRFRTLVDRFGSNPAAMKQAGIAYATDQIIDLYANGIPNAHLYTMNQPDIAAAIQRNVSAIIGEPVR